MTGTPLDAFLAAIDEAIDDYCSGHDAYVRAGAVFFEHEATLRDGSPRGEEGA